MRDHTQRPGNRKDGQESIPERGKSAEVYGPLACLLLAFDVVPAFDEKGEIEDDGDDRDPGIVSDDAIGLLDIKILLPLGVERFEGRDGLKDLDEADGVDGVAGHILAGLVEGRGVQKPIHCLCLLAWAGAATRWEKL